MISLLHSALSETVQSAGVSYMNDATKLSGSTVVIAMVYHPVRNRRSVRLGSARVAQVYSLLSFNGLAGFVLISVSPLHPLGLTFSFTVGRPASLGKLTELLANKKNYTV